MASSYLPILLILGVSVVNAVGMLAASHVLNPRRPTPEKDMPYESGMIPLGDTRSRFSVKFYMVAISFIICVSKVLFPFVTLERTCLTEAVQRKGRGARFLASM
jgi:NADH-quinone oxidoreductase subunit A